MDFVDIHFLQSAHKLSQLPETGFPEIAFAGRSNVGKSSLINKLVGRKGLVKVSGRPGKTQALNFFEIPGQLYLVDLPGYGYAKVSQNIQESWQALITSYLESRATLCCVVVVIDLRHGPKPLDTQLITWLRQKGIPLLPVYTKLDKLSRNQGFNNGRILDAGHGISSQDRILFSAKSGEGREELVRALASFTKTE